MPRMSEADKKRSYHRIVEAASRLFRERGIELTSVSDVMSAAGMTHGGFYRHFDSKDALVARAFQHAMDHAVSRVEAAQTPQSRSQAQEAYIAEYLSLPHSRVPERGCPIAALGTEAGRSGGSVQAEAAAAAKRMAQILNDPDRENETLGIAVTALMVGAVQIARLSEDQEDRNKVLSAGRSAVSLLQKSLAAP